MGWGSRIKGICRGGSKEGLRNKERFVEMKECVKSAPGALGWGIRTKGIFQDGSKDGLRNRGRCVKMGKMC